VQNVPSPGNTYRILQRERQALVLARVLHRELEREYSASGISRPACDSFVQRACRHIIDKLSHAEPQESDASIFAEITTRFEPQELSVLAKWIDEASVARG
jgi:hypothetical protein